MKDIKPTNINGQRHGEWITYHPNGNVCIKSNYVNGKRHGYEEQHYYSNGNIRKTYHLR